MSLMKPENRRLAWFYAAFLISTLIIPGITYGVGANIEGGVTRYLATEAETPVAGECPGWHWHWVLNPRNPCEMLAYAHGLRQASLWFGVFALSVPLLIILLAYFSSKNPLLMGFGFPPLVQLGNLTATGAIAGPLLLLMLAAYLALRHYLDVDMSIARIWVFLLFPILFVIPLFRLVWSLGEWDDQAMRVLPVREEDTPGIWDVVRTVAQRVKVQAPHHILLTEKPLFFVTRSRLNTLNAGEKLYGWKLGLSGPVYRLLDSDEFRAVVGHELAHLRPGLSPYILNLSASWVGFRMSARQGQPAGNPVASIFPGFSTFTVVFLSLSRFACQSRPGFEEKADRTALSACEPEHLVKAVLKTSIAGSVLATLSTEQAGDWMAQVQEKFPGNRPLAQAACIAMIAGQLNVDQVKIEIDRAEHNDFMRFHPAIAERAVALGVNYDAVIDAVLEDLRNWRPPGKDELTPVEEALTSAGNEPDPPGEAVVSPRDRVTGQE